MRTMADLVRNQNRLTLSPGTAETGLWERLV